LKRLSTGVLAAIVAVGFGLSSVSAAQLTGANGNIGTFATPTTVAQADTMPPADFGTPPSGEVPILFNDRHVYSKPDRLTQDRVLAALVRGSEILVPLRSMFEQMGATVSYDPASKTADVSKPGSDVKVTVGKAEVVINGEARPLDVPPEIYKGAIVVPVRVISEGMGAYVQWVPDKRVVVVRYVPEAPPPPPPTPVPTPVPTPKPTPKPVPPPPPPPPPTPSPSPTPKPVTYEHFVVGDYLFSPKVYNEFSSGTTGNSGTSYAVRGALEFPAFGLPWMIEGDYSSYRYQHNSTYPPPGTTSAAYGAALCGPGGPGDSAGSCVTTIGGASQVYVPGFTAQDTDVDGRFALKVVDPRIYVGVGYLSRSENYGYPRQGGFGFGMEKLPDLDQAFSVYGSIWYYPYVSASFSPLGNFAYRDLKYAIGATYSFANFSSAGLFLDGGYMGDSLKNANLAPSAVSHGAGYVGLGVKF
jgi:hypothetical protein